MYSLYEYFDGSFIIGQYLNHGNGDRCSMCNIARSGLVVSDLAAVQEKEERNEPILKKSKLGTGMKLSKNEVRIVVVKW